MHCLDLFVFCVCHKFSVLKIVAMFSHIDFVVPKPIIARIMSQVFITVLTGKRNALIGLDV